MSARTPTRYWNPAAAADRAEEAQRTNLDWVFSVEADPNGAGWFVVSVFDAETGQYQGAL